MLIAKFAMSQGICRKQLADMLLVVLYYDNLKFQGDVT